ncbi:MAG: uracil-DNA glycosylase [Bacteroidetes bacterium]|nr:uracil-DNA glycosylase [Bacteroidota bacterium]
MKDTLKKRIIEAIKDQKEIFGDELFQDKLLKRRTVVNKEDKQKAYKEPVSQLKVNEPVGSTSSKSDPLIFIPETKRAATEEQSIFEAEEDWEHSQNLDELNNLICNCQKCPLGATRNKFVFGSGNPSADVMIIGEGPGADEDAQGLPFVGRAGKLLTDILKAIKFEREEVYIANIVKCRPPGNRTPLPQEMEACLPYLKKQIELIKPKLILGLGLTAAHGLLKKKDSLTNLRGKVFEFENAKVMVTFHPAALLRNPNWKRDCWEDVKKFRKLYDDLILSNDKD